MVAGDPLNTTSDIYSVNSSPARDSGLCRHQGAGHISNSLSSFPQLCRCRLLLVCGVPVCRRGVKFIPPSAFLSPSFPPFPSSQPGRALLSTVSRRRGRGCGGPKPRPGERGSGLSLAFRALQAGVQPAMHSVPEILM